MQADRQPACSTLQLDRHHALKFQPRAIPDSSIPPVLPKEKRVFQPYFLATGLWDDHVAA
jgi:hypothetical protein